MKTWRSLATDEHQHTLVCITPKRASVELGHFYFSRANLKTLFPNAKPISEYIIREPRELHEGVTIDEQALDRRLEILSLHFDSRVMEHSGSFESVLEYGISFALDYIGECQMGISEPDPEHFDIKIGFCDLGYRHPKKGYGFEERLYFDLTF